MRLHSRNATTANSRDGYVIFAVLLVVVVLSLVAYRFTESMTAEYRASTRANDDAQAKLAAVSGLHYAAAVLSDRATFYGELEGNPFDNTDIFERVELPAAGGTARKKGLFDIRSVALTEDGSYEQRFGVIDEGGKLNINSMIALDPTGEILYATLMKLPNMTSEVADAIVDWVDGDDVARATGAESSEYSSLPNPYKAKNGPLNSLDELLLVKGVFPEMLYGGDRNRNGVFDEGENDADRGWSDYLTVYGRELNVDMGGTVRTYLNGDSLPTIAQQLGPQIGDELTTYILAAKLFNVTTTDASGNLPGTTATGTMTTGNGGAIAITFSIPQAQKPVTPASPDQLKAAVDAKMATTFTGGKRLRSLGDLVYSRITLPRASGTPQDAPDVVAFSPLLNPATRSALLGTLMDKTTVKQAVELVPRINVNTAPREVLVTLTGIVNSRSEPIITEADVDAIIAARPDQAPNDPATVSGAWVISAAGIQPAVFKRVEKYITGSTMVYRVQSIGYFAEGGPVARMEAVIDTNQGAPRFLHVRDLSDLENPRGFEPIKVNP